MIIYYVLEILKNTDPVYFILLLFPIIEASIVLFCNCYFLLYILLTQNFLLLIFKDTGIFLKNKSIFVKLNFALFTLSMGVPNLIMINNGRSVVFSTAFYILGAFLFQIYPLVGLVFFIKFLFYLESMLFVILYQRSSFFQQFILKLIFGNDIMFAEKYFTYFWGNMLKAGAKKAGPIISAGVTALGLGKNGEIEKQRADSLTWQQVDKMDVKGSMTPGERYSAYKQVKPDIINANCTQLSVQYKIEKVFETILSKIL